MIHDAAEHHVQGIRHLQFGFQSNCGACASPVLPPQAQTRPHVKVRDTFTSAQDTMASPIRKFQAFCQCRASTLSFTLPRSSLPLPVHFCHCSICRKTHGTLFSTHAPIPSPDVDLETFCSYKSSEHVTKWFCKTCGAHMLDRVDGDEVQKWYVAVSLVDTEEEVWRYTGHHFVEGTGDGGLAVKLREVGGTKMGLWKERKVEAGEFGEEGDWSPSEAETGTDVRGAEGSMLRARCHCSGVDLWIAMPKGEARTKPLDTKDPTKWSGRHCACSSCRLTTSSFIASWINIPSSAVYTKDMAPVASENLACLGTTYKSAKDVSRTFCSTCGASISYRREEEAGVVKVAAGLLEAQGSRAEDCVEWIDEVHGLEDASLRQATQALRLDTRGSKQ